MSSEEIFEQRIRLGRLFDMYGGLLTDKQKTCLDLYFNDDLSLSEISTELGVSRQAVHDLLKRVEATLENYETRLGLLAKDEFEREQLEIVINILKSGDDPANQTAINILQKCVLKVGN